jgi:tRNA modification GTPase
VGLISAKYGVGLDDLRQRLIDAAPKLPDGDVIVTSARHYEALCRAHDSLTRVIAGLGENNSQLSTINSKLSTDLVAEDLRLTLDALADITGGAITPQETLNNIFSHFCVGK